MGRGKRKDSADIDSDFEYDAACGRRWNESSRSPSSECPTRKKPRNGRSSQDGTSEEDERRRRRLIANRRSAQRSRVKRLEEVGVLEGMVEDLVKEVDALRAEVGSWSCRHEELLEEHRKLSAKLEDAGIPNDDGPPPPPIRTSQQREQQQAHQSPGQQPSAQQQPQTPQQEPPQQPQQSAQSTHSQQSPATQQPQPATSITPPMLHTLTSLSSSRVALRQQQQQQQQIKQEGGGQDTDKAVEKGCDEKEELQGGAALHNSLDKGPLHPEQYPDWESADVMAAMYALNTVSCQAAGPEAASGVAAPAAARSQTARTHAGAGEEPLHSHLSLLPPEREPQPQQPRYQERQEQGDLQVAGSAGQQQPSTWHPSSPQGRCRLPTPHQEEQPQVFGRGCEWDPSMAAPHAALLHDSSLLSPQLPQAGLPAQGLLPTSYNALGDARLLRSSGCGIASGLGGGVHTQPQPTSHPPGCFNTSGTAASPSLPHATVPAGHPAASDSDGNSPLPEQRLSPPCEAVAAATAAAITAAAAAVAVPGESASSSSSTSDSAAGLQKQAAEQLPVTPSRQGGIEAAHVAPPLGGMSDQGAAVASEGALMMEHEDGDGGMLADGWDLI
ncbi:hypothetical protein Agub_g8061 [Astrephomene gubernaculifera]|uniref:BZIP domain-containing protein n=1 Tax=Astrephomene gubernaculifera TaxID=47775 RepID=A0AAD3DR24_9CHLO|nr:hypothetical protein Agub_g8061 [Astrephomene gubernaculifera]